jgi:single-strand DNA-binding protein
VGKSVNKVILLGNVGQPPKTKTTQGGTLATMASLATSDRRKVNGEWQDSTCWHSLVFYGRLAEIARDYLTKGSKIYVEGKLNSYSYEDETQVKRYRTDIVVDDLTLLSGTKQPGASQSAPATDQSGEIADNDIPF